jgi:TPP-dependent pyruvate/acetoin dehydrogenase alpha subunit
VLKKLRIKIFEKASLCRHFETNAYKFSEKKLIKIPIYLSAGQEFISASLATIISDFCKVKPLIFAQHRCHSTYLSFGGEIDNLIAELLGNYKLSNTNCMGGSASIYSKKINMFGHDGHMGTQVPIGIGACFTSKKPTIIFMGDASAEEDYVLGALGWAATKKLPILFIVEDNNLSILTEKKVRRNWDMHDVARSFKMKGYNLKDNPSEIEKYKKFFFKEPMLLNINTNRMFWHAGAGRDSDKIFDRYLIEKKILGKVAEKIDKKFNYMIKKRWEKQLKKQ